VLFNVSCRPLSKLQRIRNLVGYLISNLIGNLIINVACNKVACNKVACNLLRDKTTVWLCNYRFAQ